MTDDNPEKADPILKKMNEDDLQEIKNLFAAQKQIMKYNKDFKIEYCNFLQEQITSQLKIMMEYKIHVNMVKGELHYAQQKKKSINLSSHDTIFKKVASLEAGIGFGELALLERRGTRNASIKAEEKCYLGVISKEDFQLSLKKIETSQKNKVMDFIGNIPYFKMLSKSAIEKIVTSLNKQVCIMN